MTLLTRTLRFGNRVRPKPAAPFPAGLFWAGITIAGFAVLALLFDLHADKLFGGRP